jgi:ribosomal protein L34E
LERELLILNRSLNFRALKLRRRAQRLPGGKVVIRFGQELSAGASFG